MKRATPKYFRAFTALHRDGKWQQYELRKQLWEEEHPEASHTEHERAMREIADELGI